MFRACALGPSALRLLSSSWFYLVAVSFFFFLSILPCMVLYGLDYRILYVCLYNTPIDVQYSMKLRHRKKKKKTKRNKGYRNGDSVSTFSFSLFPGIMQRSYAGAFRNQTSSWSSQTFSLLFSAPLYLSLPHSQLLPRLFPPALSH